MTVRFKHRIVTQDNFDIKQSGTADLDVTATKKEGGWEFEIVWCLTGCLIDFESLEPKHRAELVQLAEDFNPG